MAWGSAIRPASRDADERRPRGKKTGALSKAEQPVVIGNVKKKIPGGLILALKRLSSNLTPE
jgi:hypothetical protein